jgi:hypothetical protein
MSNNTELSGIDIYNWITNPLTIHLKQLIDEKIQETQEGLLSLPMDNNLSLKTASIIGVIRSYKSIIECIDDMREKYVK